MIFNYEAFKRIPSDASLIPLIKFVGDLENARLRPSLDPATDDWDFPPMFIFWFKEENDETNKFIANAVNNFNWKDSWLLETKRGKWLLYPKRAKEVEQKLQKIEKLEDVKITDNAFVWLMKNEPEFGRRTNQDLLDFTAYFRGLVGEYLKQRGRSG